MQVTRAKPRFTPIVVTLESNDEILMVLSALHNYHVRFGAVNACQLKDMIAKADKDANSNS